MSLLKSIIVFGILQVCVYGLYHKDITPKTIDKLLDPSKSHILLELYAPWCGHCKNLAPEYERLGEVFKTTEDVVIAQIDADKHKTLGKRFGVKGFPTLKWIPKGSTFEKAEEPNAERTAEGLLKYVNEKTGYSKKLGGQVDSAVETITSQSFKEITTAVGKHSFIGFFAPWCGHCKAMKPTWEKLANVYSDDEHITIGSIDCDEHKDFCHTQKVEGFPTLKYFSDGVGEKYEKGRDINDLIQFVNEKSGLDYSQDGGVHENAGVIKELSEHIQSYMTATTEEERTNVVNTCTEKVDDLDPKAISYFMYYKKVFAKIAEKGIAYVKNEKSRLSKILDTSDSLKNTQKRSFMRRLNVLNAFDKN